MSRRSFGWRRWVRRALAGALGVSLAFGMASPAAAGAGTSPAPEPHIVSESLSVSPPADGRPASPARQGRAPEIIVRYRRQPGPGVAPGASTPAAPRGPDAAGALLAAGAQVVRQGQGGRPSLLRLAPGADVKAALAALKGDPGVEYAEPNYTLHAADAPNDPRYAEQWGLAEAEAEPAWTAALAALRNDVGNAAPVTVAVLDTGVDAAHEDLAGRIGAGRNLISGAAHPAGVADDSADGHGTHVAGIIAATTNNALGVAGAVYQLPVTIMPVKVLDSAGIGTMYDVAQGITWAVDNGAKVINLSLGARLPDYPMTLADAVRYALDHGAIVVAAAGNDGGSVDGFYPAALPGVVSVGASGRDHSPASFSNRGGLVWAPGVDILSTLPGNRYGTMSGTSMAAPFASAAAALLWATYPGKPGPEVTAALRMGQRDFPYNCKTYWWGTVCDHHYVLSLRGALARLAAGTATPADSLLFREPSYGARVAGTVRISVQTENPDPVARVVFTLDSRLLRQPDEPSPTVIGTVYGPDAGGTARSGLFSLSWDSTGVADGRHIIFAQSLDARGDVLAEAMLDVIVENQQRSGLAIHVRKPGGADAAGAQVAVYHVVPAPDGPRYEEVRADAADLQGRFILPGSVATDGNDYLILAWGREPNFLYTEVVRAPARVTLDAANAQRVALAGRRVDGRPLAAALFLATPLDASGQKYAMEGGDRGPYPLATLNASGQGEVYLTRGRYDLQLVSARDSHYLTRRNAAITDATTALDWTPAAAEAATIRLAPAGSLTLERVRLFVAEDANAFTGFDLPAPDVAVTVTPGTYSTMIEAVHRQPDGAGTSGTEWTWELSPPPIQVAGGEDRAVPFGGPLTATIGPHPYFGVTSIHAGGIAYFSMDFPDAYGNATSGVAAEPYTAASAGADRAAEPRILRRTVTPAAGASSAPRAGTAAPAASPPPRADTYRYDPAGGRFELIAQARAQAQPRLVIRDAAGQAVSADADTGAWYDGDRRAWTSYWFVPPAQTPARYEATASLAAGPFGPESAGGTAESQAFPFDLLSPVPVPTPDLTVQVKDATGAPVAGADVTLQVKSDSGHYSPLPDVDSATTDAQGYARFVGLPALTPDTYALTVVGPTSQPGNPDLEKEPMFLFVPLPGGPWPQQLVVDGSTFTLHRVVIRPRNVAGEDLNGAEVSAYAEDASGAQAAVALGYSRSGGFPLWLPAGRYTFQADAPFDYSSDGHMYHLVSGRRSIPADAAGGEVTFGGPDLASVSVQPPEPPESGRPEHAAVGVAFFGPDSFRSPIFEVGFLPSAQSQAVSAAVYVTPGPMLAEVALVRIHYDGDWTYWLDRDLSPAPGAAVTFPVAGPSRASLTLSSPVYGPGDEIRSTHRIEDAHGNRVVAVRIGPYYGEPWSSAARAPGTSAAGTGSTPPKQTRTLLAERVPGAGPRVYAAEAPARGGGLTALNHTEIAPFFSISDPAGRELIRFKDTPGTFFGARYALPQDVVGGQYTATLELGAMPEGPVVARQTFDVSAAPAAPVLDPPASPTKLTDVTVTGTAAAGATVTVRFRRDGGAPTDAGSAAAGPDRRFSVGLTLPGEGSYALTAVASRGGVAGPESQPVSIIVDQTPPASPTDLVATAPDDSHVTLTWMASGSPDVAGYRIRRDGTQVGETAQTTFRDSGLTPNREYQYEVVALDRAGNVSAPATVRATPSGRDTEPPSPPTGLWATARSSSSIELEWQAATDNAEVTGYRIWRATGTDAAAATVVGAVYGASALRFVDTSVDAETRYTYVVTAVDAAGNESKPSQPATAVTPPIGIDSIAYAVPRSRSGLARLGETLRIELRGDRGRRGEATVRYRSWYDAGGNLQDAPMPREDTVHLTEDAGNPGRYTGLFVIAAGISELTAIEGALRDAAGHVATRAAAGPSLGVTGTLAVDVTASSPELPSDTLLLAWSDAARSGATVPLGGSGRHILADLAPGDQYELRILHDGRELARRVGVAVVAGREVPVTLPMRLPASLDVDVKDPAGAPVAGIDVSFATPDGRYLGAGRSDTSGHVGPAPDRSSVPLLLEGDEVIATVHVGDRSYVDRAVSRFVIAAGANRQTIELAPLPEVDVFGRVTQPNGTAAPGVTVTALQDVNGRRVVRPAVSDLNGDYRLSIFADYAAEVRAGLASGRVRGPDPQTITVPARGTRRLDLQLQSLIPVTVTAAVYTRYAGQSTETLQDMDWRTAVHFGLTVHDAQGGSHRGAPYPVTVPGSPGDIIRVTVSGNEAGVSSASTEVPVGPDYRAHAELHLVERGGLRVHVRDEEGKFRPGAWKAHMLRCPVLEAGGCASSNFERPRTVSNELFEVRGLPPGNYMLWFTGAGYQQRQGLTFSIADGEITDLGTVTMWSASGKNFFFGGFPGNAVTAMPGDAAPGDVATIRVAYRNGRQGTADDARLELQIPGGTELVPGSITLNGQVPAGLTVAGAVYSIPIGTIPQGGSGVASYQVRLSADFAQTRLVVPARMRYRTSGVEQDEIVGFAEVRLLQATLDAPGRLRTMRTTLSGRAPAGSTVRVYDGSVLIGEALARGSYWRMEVNLADAGSPSWHRLRADAVTAAGTLSSPVQPVYYDADEPAVLEVAMQQQDGRRIAFDPSGGVAVFPYVYNPRKPMTFTVRPNNDRVYDVEIETGDGRGVTASRSNDGTYSAYFTPSYRPPGAIYLKYKTRPSQDRFKKAPPTLNQFRQRLPFKMADFVKQQVTFGGASTTGASLRTAAAAPIAASVQVGLPQKNATMKVDWTFQRGLSYTPSQEDLAAAQATGLPVYGLTWSAAEENGVLVAHVNAYIEESAVDATDVTNSAVRLLAAAMAGAAGGAPALGGATGEGAAGGGTLRAAAATTVIKVGAALNFGLSAYDTYDMIDDSLGYNAKFPELNRLIDQAASDCGPAMAAAYRDIAEMIGTDIMAAQATVAGLQIAGVLLAPETFGLGTIALWGIGELIEYAIEKSIDKGIENLKNMIANDEDCERDDDPQDPPDPEHPGRKKVADPRYIMDPSGYVYEAVPGNRLEGVTATILEQDPTTGAWSVWDAAWYGQANPQTTDPQGRYGWDVPMGNWRVTYQKPGYQDGDSGVIPVPPPRTDVNVGLVSTAAPAVVSVNPAGDGAYVDIGFTKYMRVATVTDSTVAVAVYGGAEDGATVAGTLAPVDPETVGEVQLARTFRFTPAAPLVVGASYDVTVSQLAQSYAGTPMAADDTRRITVSAAPDTQAPTWPAGSRVTASNITRDSATLTWTEATDNVGVTGYHVYDAGGGTPLATAAGDARSHTLTHLSPGRTYTFKIEAIDAAGNVSTTGPTVTLTTMASAPPGDGSGGGGSSPGPAPRPSVPDAVSETIHPATGGTVALADGSASVTVPAGATDQPVTITISPVAPVAAGTTPPAPPPAAESGLVRVGNHIYQVVAETAQGQAVRSFRAPLTLTFQISTADLSAARQGGGTPIAFYHDEAHRAWIALPGAFDETTGRLTASTDHLTVFAVFASAKLRRPADVAQHWAAADVLKLMSLGVVSGYEDGTFRPERGVTRAEFAKLLSAALGLVEATGASEPFADDAAIPEWAKPYVTLAKRAGLISGFEDGSFRPGEPITREQMAVLLQRAGKRAALAAPGGQPPAFVDAASISGWAREAVGEIAARGIVGGYPDGTFQPGRGVTRAEAARMLARFMDLVAARRAVR